MKHYLPLFRGLVLTMILAIGFVSVTLANVGVTTTATGGTNISADNAANSTSPVGGAWTTLGNIVITESANGDIANTFGSNKTFLINAPSGWTFRNATITTTASGSGLTIVSTTRTSATQITVTYNCSSTSSINSFTINGIQVQATAGAPTPQSGNITTATGTGTIANINGLNCGSLSLTAGAFKKLLVLLPGQTISPGSTTGKTGTVTAQTAGTAFNVTVDGVDQFWNLVSSATDNIQLSSTDGAATMPSADVLASGTKTFSVTLVTAGGQTVTATDATNGTITANTSSSVTINGGAPTTLNISSISSPQSVNNNFSITITGTDQYGNAASGSVALTTSAGAITPTTATIGIATNVSENTAGTNRTITGTAGSVFVTSNPFDVLATTATDYFRSQASGNWGTAATWQSSHDSSVWFTATLVPTSSAKRVIIQGTNNVAIAATLLSTPNITISSGATLTVSSGRTLTLSSSSDTSLYILGTLSNSGIVALNAGALIAVDNGGTYNHAQNGGTIPTAHWDNNSTCNISGMTSTVPSGLGQAFGNFIWSSNQTSATNLLGALNTVNGTFTYSSTSASSLRLVSTGVYTLNVGGDFVVNSNVGTIRFTDGTSAPTINIAGDLDIQAGTLTFDDGSNGIATANISGDVDITGGTLDPNVSGTVAHIIKVGGNWTLNNAGTFTAGSAGVTFNGSSAQTIGGTKSTAFNNLTINGAGVTISKSATVSGVLNFTNGIINTATATLLTINNTGSVTNASNNSFVNGPITKIGNSAFTFPIGATGTGYVPIGISAPSSINSAFLAQYNRGSAAALGTVTAAGLDHMNVCDYWTLNSTGTPSSAINVIGYWNTSSPCNGEALNYYINDINHVALAHLVGGSWSAFGNISITGDNVTGGSVTFNTVSTFSSAAFFAIGSTTKANPLPVTLINFRAILNSNNSVSLTWQTVAEENSNYFDVQRSDDGKNWSSIGTVEAQGNSDVTVNYSEMDLSPLKGADYYRLRLVNTNGSSSYSDIRVITMNAITAFRIFPNPATDYVNVSLGQISNNSVVRMFNLSGQVVFSQQLNNASGNTISVPVHNLAEGTYTLQVMGSDGTQQSGRVIIVR